MTTGQKDWLILLLVLLSCVGFIVLGKIQEPYTVQTQKIVINKSKAADEKLKKKIKKIKQEHKKTRQK